MVEQNVQANSLSCLLNADSSVELIPEPFRMQKNVIFRVTYSEYSNYILSLQQNTNIILANDVAYLRSLASTGNPKLYACFLQDLAFAICKEISFAERYKRDATVILPSAYNRNDILLTQCLIISHSCSDAEIELRHRIHQAGFGLTKVEKARNVQLFNVAVVLYSLSKVQTAMKEVNLVYDLG